MIKGLLLYNPKSGDQKIKNKLDHIIKRFQNAGILLVLFRMFQEEDFSGSLLEMIRSEKFNFIILAGGDGSLNFFVNFMYHHDIHLPLGIFPCGTCNDFARDIGMSNNINDWISIVLSGKTRMIDAGCINDHHYFLGNLGGGLFANVSFNTSSDQKKNLGSVAYYLNALSELPQIEVFDIHVETEHYSINEKIILFLVLNGRNVAGFSNFLKEADMEDGLMDILLFRNAKPMELANLFIKMLSNELSNDKHIIHLRTNECRIQTNRPIRISVDGEKGTLLPIRVKCVHPGLQLFHQS